MAKMAVTQGTTEAGKCRGCSVMAQVVIGQAEIGVALVTANGGSGSRQ